MANNFIIAGRSNLNLNLRKIMPDEKDLEAKYDLLIKYLKQGKKEDEVVKTLIKDLTRAENEYGRTTLVDSHGNTALYLAARKGHKEIVELLIEAGADVNKVDSYGNTALYSASMSFNFHEEVAELLIKNMTSESINKLDGNGQTALHRTAKNGYINLVKQLIKAGAEVNQVDKNGMSALSIASEDYNIEVMDSLIEAGADLNNADDKYGQTALHSLARGGRRLAAKLLLDARADVNKVDKQGYTALHSALLTPYDDLGDNKEMVELFIGAGADLNQAGSHGLGALGIAALLGKNDIVKLLIETGKCDLNAELPGGRNIWTVYPPTEGKNIEMVELLMKHGAKYPEPERDGELQKIANNTQGAHKQGKLAEEQYQKFEGKDKLQEMGGEFLEKLNKVNTDLKEEDHIKMVKELIGCKYKDMSEGQGEAFIKDVCGILKPEKPGATLEELEAELNNLSTDKQVALANYAKKKIDDTIKYYAKDNAKPFSNININGTTKEFFGVFGAKIEDKLSDQKDIGDTIPDTLREIFDAGTMYESGGKSCANGMVNKMFNSSAWLFDDNNEVKKGANFEGFKVNYDALLTASTMRLEESGEKELVDKIINKERLNSLEVQKIASIINDILKNTKNNKELAKDCKFSDIVRYGEAENILTKDEKIEQFCRELEYGALSQQTYGNLFKKDGSGQYIQNTDKLAFGVGNDDLQPPQLESKFNELLEFIENGNIEKSQQILKEAKDEFWIEDLLYAKNKEGETALHMAAIKGDKELVDSLLKAGADINQVNKEGETALRKAIIHKSDRGVINSLIRAEFNKPNTEPPQEFKFKYQKKTPDYVKRPDPTPENLAHKIKKSILRSGLF